MVNGLTPTPTLAMSGSNHKESRVPPKDTMFEVEVKHSRQAQINALDTGGSVSITQRFELAYGLPVDTLRTVVDKMRSNIEQQVTRSRRGHSEKKFVVENGSFVTRAGALVVTVVATRVA